MRSRPTLRFGTLLLVSAALCCPLPAAAVYQQLHRVILGGEGGWDYLTLDPQARRLYISRSSHVLVLDADSLKDVGEIPNTPGVHGVALAENLGRGFTSNGADTSATIFDLKSLKVLGKVRTGLRPDAIVFDPASGRVFTMNAGGDDATAIDAATGKAVGSVSLGGRPEFAVVDGRGRLFVNLEDKNSIAVVETKTLSVVAHWPLVGGDGPTGLALDREHHRLFSGCANQVMIVLDSESGQLITSLPIGAGVDGVAFDPGTGLAFSSNGEGTLTVVEEVSPTVFTVRENVPTQVGARTLALDEPTHLIFTVTGEFGPAPKPTADHPHPRRPVLPGTFTLLVLGNVEQG